MSLCGFISYLVLLEAGLGAASTQALYKPLSENDWDKAGSIMSATAKSYRRHKVLTPELRKQFLYRSCFNIFHG